MSELPDGMRYFCIARAIRKGGAGFSSESRMMSIGLGCEAKHAAEMVYSDNMILGAEAKAAPIGVNCRICDRMDCPQRAHPPVHLRARIDENMRGPSPYVTGATAERLPTR